MRKYSIVHLGQTNEVFWRIRNSKRNYPMIQKIHSAKLPRKFFYFLWMSLGILHRPKWCLLMNPWLQINKNLVKKKFIYYLIYILYINVNIYIIYNFLFIDYIKILEFDLPKLYHSVSNPVISGVEYFKDWSDFYTFLKKRKTNTLIMYSTKLVIFFLHFFDIKKISTIF